MSSTTKVSQPKSMMDLQHVVGYAFVIAIIVLLVSLGTITVMMVVRPPCTIAGTVCADGWSVAGLAAVILGVGGTMLTVISGLAVAAWWVGLDKKVETQVKDQVADTLDTLLEKHLEPIKNELSSHQNAIDDISTRLKNSDAELDFLRRQLEGILRFTIYTAFPNYMELEDFNLSDLEAFMNTIRTSAPLVNANIYQAALARFWDALDPELEALADKNEADHAVVNKKLEIEEMLGKFSSFTAQFVFPFTDHHFGMNKKYLQREASELDRIGKDVTDQITKRSPSIRQKISVSDEVTAQLRKEAEQKDQDPLK